MQDLFVASVGDGFCGGIARNSRGYRYDYAQLDWGGGSISSAYKGYEELRRHFGFKTMGWPNHLYTDGPREFILSHYHVDHYLGLMAAARPQEKNKFLWAPDFVYTPGLPKFQKAYDFYCALFCMSAKVFGSESGSMDFDFLRAISRLRKNTPGISSKSKFKYRQLFQGDEFLLNGQRCIAVWPPRTMNDSLFATKVEKALKKFDEAMNADQVLREIYDRILNENFFELLRAWGEEGKNEFTYDEFESDIREAFASREDEPLLQVVEDANKELRSVANDLSLGFFSEEGLLFLGDISKAALPKVVDKLVSLGEVNFNYLIASHHGTFWDDSLLKLRANMVIISTGKKLAAKYNPNWSMVGVFVLSTYLNGHIRLGEGINIPAPIL